MQRHLVVANRSLAGEHLLTEVRNRRPHRVERDFGLPVTHVVADAEQVS